MAAVVEVEVDQVEVDLMVEGVVRTSRILTKKITTTETKVSPEVKAMKLLPV